MPQNSKEKISKSLNFPHHFPEEITERSKNCPLILSKRTATFSRHFDVSPLGAQALCSEEHSAKLSHARCGISSPEDRRCLRGPCPAQPSPGGCRLRMAQQAPGAQVTLQGCLAPAAPRTHSDFALFPEDK